MKTKRFILTLVFLVIATLVQANTDNEFPARKLFPAVPYIELDDLYKKFDKVIIVDVRSKYEYDTLKIAGALNIPVLEANFNESMKKLRADNPGKEIVTYCNGKTCKKSYEAVQKCRNLKIDNVTAYDAGIFDWTKKYPHKAELFGVTPVDLRKLISKEDLNKRMINIEDFEGLLTNKDVIVLDVREPLQREGLSLFPGIDHQADLDDKPALDRYVNQAIRENKTLLVYDAAGKQVEWLMYYLEHKDLKKYAFMKGGAHAYFANMRKQYVK